MTTIFNKLETYSQNISNISVGIFFLWNRQRRYFWSNRYFDPVGLLVRRVSRATRMKGHRRLNRNPLPSLLPPVPGYRAALAEGDYSGNKGNYKEVRPRTRGTEDDASDRLAFYSEATDNDGLTTTRSSVKYSGNILAITPIFDLPGTVLESASERPTSLPERRTR